jgi:superfamily II DNA/RNA helicase
MRNLGSNSCSSITDETKAEDKNAALNRLRDEAGHILITTYWEAQKFDIPRVDRVINYDMPATVEEYIRGISYMVYAGCFGHDYATTFVNRRDHVAILHIVELFTLHGLSFPVVLAKPNELVAAGMPVYE